MDWGPAEDMQASVDSQEHGQQGPAQGPNTPSPPQQPTQPDQQVAQMLAAILQKLDGAEARLGALEHLLPHSGRGGATSSATPGSTSSPACQGAAA